MTGPGWLAGVFAALMLTVATYCAGRLVAARARRRPTELDTDGAHVVMGVAMAGMLVSGLRTFPVSLWSTAFAAGAAWFGYHTLRARRAAPATPWRCLQPAPHLVECLAMLFMLLAVPASAAFLALLPAVFLLGWVVRLADRLAVPVPAFAAAPGGGSGAPGAPGRLGMPLAPRCAVLCSMAMGITMGYLLITML
jgi:Domain of unknown function (DUF5134)